ncbi:hypothetical protein DL767_003435 [Monosporascus sp. MG133]|nr:hypothetical protein DL767_003435 [Monosporascus sp. MG133]
MVSVSEVSEVDHFMARGEELAKIHKLLGEGTGRRTAVVHGLGGMGKTQLTAAYAKRHRNDYSALFWLNARDETSLKQSFARVAERILGEHPSVVYAKNAMESRDLDEAVGAVKRWLDQPKNDGWLMIYDNYDNPTVEGHGKAKAGQRAWGRKRRVRGSGSHSASFENWEIASRFCRIHLAEKPYTKIFKLAEELDGLPLALATAGAYLYNVATSFADYAKLYRESWEPLQDLTPGLLSYEDRALFSTWNTTERGNESRGYNMHGCVHSWTKQVLNKLWDTELAHLAMRCVGAHVPLGTAREYWVVQRRLMQHADRCLAKVTTEEMSTVNNLGNLYKKQGRLSDAEAMYERALQGLEKALGHDRVDNYTQALNIIQNLAALYPELKRVSEAETLYLGC